MASEHRAATERRSFRHQLRYRAAHWAHAPDWVRHDVTGERWKDLEAVRPLPGLEDAILLIPLFGHTPGHTGVALRQGTRWLLHAGDAYFDSNEIRGSGKVPIGLKAFGRAAATDNRMRLQNVERLRSLEREHADVTMFCAHARAELDAMRGEPTEA